MQSNGSIGVENIEDESLDTRGFFENNEASGSIANISKSLNNPRLKPPPKAQPPSSKNQTPGSHQPKTLDLKLSGPTSSPTSSPPRPLPHPFELNFPPPPPLPQPQNLYKNRQKGLLGSVIGTESLGQHYMIFGAKDMGKLGLGSRVRGRLLRGRHCGGLGGDWVGVGDGDGDGGRGEGGVGVGVGVGVGGAELGRVWVVPRERGGEGWDENYRTSPLKGFIEDFENSEMGNKNVSYKSPFLEKFKRNMHKNCKQYVTAQNRSGSVEKFTKTVDDRLTGNQVLRY